MLLLVVAVFSAVAIYPWLVDLLSETGLKSAYAPSKMIVVESVNAIQGGFILYVRNVGGVPVIIDRAYIESYASESFEEVKLSQTVIKAGEVKTVAVPYDVELGKQYRIKLTTTAGSMFSLVYEVLEISSANWLLGWQYRRAITIDNTGGSSTLTDFQVKVILTTANFDYSKANSDGSDIRFTDEDGKAKLSYWIKKWDPSGTSEIWVKVPNIPASSTKTIYMYYGNSPAASESNGPATFEFYDDMESWSGWVKHGSGVVFQDTTRVYEGHYSAQKDLYCDPNGAYKSIGKTLGRNVVLEAYINRNGSSVNCLCDRIGLIDNSGNGYGVVYCHSGSSYIGVDVRTNYSPVVQSKTYVSNYVDTWVFARLTIKSSGDVVSELYLSDGTFVGSSSCTNNTYSSFTNVYIFGGYNYWVDLMIVRKYAEPMPTTSLGSEETPPWS